MRRIKNSYYSNFTIVTLCYGSDKKPSIRDGNFKMKKLNSKLTNNIHEYLCINMYVKLFLKERIGTCPKTINFYSTI